MNVILLGNYRPDAQQSMLRFGELLEGQLKARGHEVCQMRPRRRAGIWFGGGGRTGKWLGYVDKYLLFPGDLSRRLRAMKAREPSIVHVLDHSNAVYLPRKPPVPWVITCHDLLAVRGALGEDTDCPASWLGALSILTSAPAGRRGCTVPRACTTG